MSKARAYSQDTLDAMTRFFQAIIICRDNGLLDSVTDFCVRHNIDKAHFYTQRKNLGRGFFEVGWMSALVDDCGVSAHWLLTGKGTMFPI